MKQLTILSVVVLFTIMACSAGQIAEPNYPTADAELAKLTPKEHAAIPADAESVLIRHYPDAVVYMSSSEESSAVYVKYKDENSVKLEGGSIRRPPTSISLETDSRKVGTYVIVQESKTKVCIPKTDDCSKYSSTHTVVLREEPILGGEIRSSSGLFHYADSYMLEVTWTEVDSFLVEFLSLFPGMVSTYWSGDCEPREDGTMRERREVRATITEVNHGDLRWAIVQALSRDGYLTYHALQPWRQTLRRFNHEVYCNTDLQEWGRVIAEVRSIMSTVFAHMPESESEKPACKGNDCPEPPGKGEGKPSSESVPTPEGSTRI